MSLPLSRNELLFRLVVLWRIRREAGAGQHSDARPVENPQTFELFSFSDRRLFAPVATIQHFPASGGVSHR
jgi:hypothetical protein